MKQRLSAHLIRPGDLNPGWVLLYAVTWALQYFCAACRFLLIDAVLALLDLITGWGWPVNIPSVVIGFGPLGISLATLVLPLGGWWFQQQLGGRRPSGREQAVFEAAFEQLRAADPKLRAPRRWFLSEDPEPNACAYADTLMVTSGMLGEPILPGRPRPRARAPELKRCPGHCGALPDDHAAAQSDGVSLPPDRLPDQRAGRDGLGEDTVGDLLAPPRGGCRCLRGQARAGRSACGLPRYPRPRRRSADPVQGLRRHLPSLDRAPHRRSRSATEADGHEELCKGKVPWAD